MVKHFNASVVIKLFLIQHALFVTSLIDFMCQIMDWSVLNIVPSACWNYCCLLVSSLFIMCNLSVSVSVNENKSDFGPGACVTNTKRLLIKNHLVKGILVLVVHPPGDISPLVMTCTGVVRKNIKLFHVLHGRNKRGLWCLTVHGNCLLGQFSIIHLYYVLQVR